MAFFWLAPFLPLGAFALLAVGLSRFGRLAAGLASGALAGGALVSGLGLLAAARGTRTTVSLPWLVVGGRRFELALWLDPLGALAATLVAVVGLVVFVYAASYLAGDARYGRFFAEFSLFVGAMLALVLAADLITLFIAWELVGLCSYLLIGFWFEEPGVPPAATKAFLVTRLGDLALLAGLLLLVGATGGGGIAAVLAAVAGGALGQGTLLAVALLLFAGAASKSAQVPFQGWLPDAMAAPTPVSALLHSATMVAAGVFLVARLYPLFLAAGPALPVVAGVGTVTALLGALAALVQTDLKRLLAYSTMSQLGLMFVGLGAGSLLAGMLLLVAQALYKATLFLAAGALDHAVGGRTFERMGGLARRMPATFAAFAIATAALAGLPVTLALPAKDPTLAAAWAANPALFVAALAASFGTALYSARALGLAFLGPPSAPAREAQEAAPGLLWPALAMATLVPPGLLANGALAGRPLARLLGAATPEAAPAAALGLLAAALGLVLGLGARFVWPGALVWPVLRRVAPLFGSEFGLVPAYRALARLGLRFVGAVGTFDQWVFDPLGVRLAGGVLSATRRAGRFDRASFDALAGATARGTLDLVRAGARFDRRGLDAGVRRFGAGLLGLSQRARRLQTGRIENYLLAVFIWGLGIIVAAALAASLFGR